MILVKLIARNLQGGLLWRRETTSNDDDLDEIESVVLSKFRPCFCPNLGDLKKKGLY